VYAWKRKGVKIILFVDGGWEFEEIDIVISSVSESLNKPEPISRLFRTMNYLF